MKSITDLVVSATTTGAFIALLPLTLLGHGLIALGDMTGRFGFHAVGTVSLIVSQASARIVESLTASIMGAFKTAA